MRVLDLFSGIGGFSLGLERAGMRTVAFCEINPFCRQVLARHWPGIRCYENVTTLTGERVRRDAGDVDVICGGFPCQDVSVAGTGKGLDGDRSGLWRQMWRLISELRPRYAIIENVAALTGRGLDRVLGNLASIGYDAEWHCIPAAAVGAPHIRDRIWIVAYPNGAGLEGRDGEVMPERSGKRSVGACGSLAYADSVAAFGPAIARQERCSWFPEPDVGRVAHGVPRRMDRIKALGNSVVPQIPEIIGRAIMEVEAR